MKPFKSLKSRVIRMNIDHVDTDMIIPAQFLTKVDKAGYGEHVFRRMRDQDPDFVFNDPIHKDSEILLAGKNFGCGSSREHAVWAIAQAGIRVVIAKSFSDIFYNNSAKNGLLLITLESEVVDALFRHDDLHVTVDLEEQSITVVDGKGHAFEYDAFRKACFLKGQDDMDYLLEATK